MSASPYVSLLIGVQLGESVEGVPFGQLRSPIGIALNGFVVGQAVLYLQQEGSTESVASISCFKVVDSENEQSKAIPMDRRLPHYTDHVPRSGPWRRFDHQVCSPWNLEWCSAGARSSCCLCNHSKRSGGLDSSDCVCTSRRAIELDCAATVADPGAVYVVLNRSLWAAVPLALAVLASFGSIICQFSLDCM